MKKTSALYFSASSLFVMVAAEIWRRNYIPNYRPYNSAFVFGVFVFAAVVLGLIFYAYGAASRKFRRDKRDVSAYGWMVLFGGPFGHVLDFLHRSIGGKIAVAHSLWDYLILLIEAIGLSAVVFEFIVFLNRRFPEKPNQ